jgi:hypothetical protein
MKATGKVASNLAKDFTLDYSAGNSETENACDSSVLKRQAVWLIHGGHKMETSMENLETKPPAGWTSPSRVVLIVDLIGTLLLAVMTLRTVPKFTVIFRELLNTVPLPRITEFFVSIPSTGYFIIFSGMMIALVLKEITLKNKAGAFAINMVMLIVGIVYFVLYMVAMFLPLLHIINNIAEKN